MDEVYKKLDKLFLVDENQQALTAYGNFEKYVRPESATIADYQIEFDRMVAQLKEHKIVLPEPVLAYRALKSAVLGEDNEKLVLATVRDVTLDDMMFQIRKVMQVNSANLRVSSDQSGVGPVSHIKTEPADVHYGENYANSEYAYDNGEEQTEDAYYGFGNNRGRRGGSLYPRFSRGKPRGRRGNNSYQQFGNNTRRQNPTASNGRPSRCAICSSTMHWAKDCQHNEEKGDSDDVAETNLVLMSLHINKDDSSLLGEPIGCAVLDSGCNKTVCGLEWYNCFLDTLPEKASKKIETKESTTTFRFGNDQTLRSKFKVTIPCIIGGVRVDINTDVVESSIPLLLSKTAMKKANTILDFEKDCAFMFGNKLPLKCTISGHYYIPLNRPSNKSEESLVMYCVKDLQNKTLIEKTKVVEKLHRQFSHPSAEKLVTLVKSAGVTDDELLIISKHESTV